MPRKSWRQFLSLTAIFFIGYFLVYLVYFVFTVNYPVSKQVADTKIILTSLANQSLADLNVKMAGNDFSSPVRPLSFWHIDGRPTIRQWQHRLFLGQISAAGWWYYFPVVFFLKEPLPSLILILAVLLFGFWGAIKELIFKISKYKILISKFNNYLGTHFPEFSMMIFIAFYWLYSMQSSLNIGIRHIIPTMPFIYILIAAGLKNWTNSSFGIILQLPPLP